MSPTSGTTTTTGEFLRAIRASAEQHAEKLVLRELSRRRWAKNDPGNAKIARRLRRQTTMTYE